MEPQILLVEDHTQTRLALASLLQHAGYQVQVAAGGEQALRLLAEQQFALVISDIWMDPVNGIEVLYAARQQARAPAVMLLTGSGSLDTSIAALRAGAFDYLQKPYDPAALLERVSAALQQRASELQQADALRLISQIASQAQASATINPGPATTPGTTQQPAVTQIGALRIGQLRQAVTFADQPLHLTQTEFAIIRCLSEAPGDVLTCRELIRRVHGYEISEADARILLKAHIRNLRRKIGPEYLVNVHGLGYRLSAPAES